MNWLTVIFDIEIIIPFHQSIIFWQASNIASCDAENYDALYFFNTKKTNNPVYLSEDSHGFKMAELADIRWISKESSEMQSQNLKSQTNCLILIR